MPKPNRFILALSIAAAVFIAIAGGITIALRNAGSWLVVSDKSPESIDMLFTFGGDIDRYTFSKKIAGAHPEAFWAISVGYIPMFDTLTVAAVVRRNTVMEGFDTARIIVNDTCTSTGAEITVLTDLVSIALGRAVPELSEKASAEDSLWHEEKTRLCRWFSERQADTLDIALVSHPYHMRRIKMLVARNMDLPIRIHMLPVPLCGCANRFARARKWWRDEEDASFVISELIKIAYYFTVRDHR
jgi:hypothetical protein